MRTARRAIFPHVKARHTCPCTFASGRSRYGNSRRSRMRARCIRMAKARPPGCRNLIWRDFYAQLLWHHPRVIGEAFKPEYAGLRFPGEVAGFNAWCAGRTGYPIVDAAMRQLNTTGYMHNRLRMIVASFLVKDLLVDWRLGEKYFAERLIDFDLASNNGGWQWAASTGCDAQPYFRIFNPGHAIRAIRRDRRIHSPLRSGTGATRRRGNSRAMARTAGDSAGEGRGASAAIIPHRSSIMPRRAHAHSRCSARNLARENADQSSSCRRCLANSVDSCCCSSGGAGS